MTPQVITWDWKAQAPMNKIARLVMQFSAQGPVWMREAPEEWCGDSYMWVISDHELSAAELTALLEE